MPPKFTRSSACLSTGMISGDSGKPFTNGYSMGSPKRRAKARNAAGGSSWSRKKITPCSSHARRMAAMVASSSGPARSTPEISAPSAPATGSTTRDRALMTSHSSRGREGGHRRPAFRGREHDAHLLTDADAVEVGAHDVGHHGDAFLERHVGDAVRRLRPAHHAPGVDAAAAGGLLPLRAVAPAEGTDRAGVVVDLAAGQALLEEEAALGGALPEGLGLGIGLRRGDLPLGGGHHATPAPG